VTVPRPPVREADRRRPPRRFRGLARVDIRGRRVPLASTFLSRLLGLATLDREAAGAGLLIPDCNRVHTFGMRFDLDLVFLDGRGAVVATIHSVPPRRLLHERRARSVLELPAAAPEEISPC
jgi:uncharacterized protein